MAFLTDALSAYSSYRANKTQSRIDEKMRNYKNSMTNIAAAMSSNAVTANTTRNIQQSARKAVALDRDEITAVGAATVNAAAAGVRGNSVDSTITNIERGAGLLEHQRELDLDGMLLQSHFQRESIHMQRLQNQDYSYISKPSLAAGMFGAVANNLPTAFEGGKFNKQTFFLGGE